MPPSLAKFKVEDSEELGKDLRQLDALPVRTADAVTVFYVKAGQTKLVDILQNVVNLIIQHRNIVLNIETAKLPKVNNYVNNSFMTPEIFKVFSNQIGCEFIELCHDVACLVSYSEVWLCLTVSQAKRAAALSGAATIVGLASRCS
jgi:hypothetical protein